MRLNRVKQRFAMDYFVAALHVVVRVPQLVNYARDPVFLDTLCTKRKNACEFARGFAAFADEHWTRETCAVPGDLLASFVKANRGFRADRQHDARDVVTMVLDTLHEALSKFPWHPTVKDHPVAFRGNPGVWGQSSMVSEIFRGQRVTDVHENVHENFTVLKVQPRDTLTKALAAEGTFARLPLALFIALLKDPDDKHFVSYDAAMTLVENGDPVQYLLAGVMMHHSHPDTNWTTLCRVRGEWRHLVGTSTGTLVTPVKANDILQRDAMMLLYLRKL